MAADHIASLLFTDPSLNLINASQKINAKYAKAKADEQKNQFEACKTQVHGLIKN